MERSEQGGDTDHKLPDLSRWAGWLVASRRHPGACLAPGCCCERPTNFETARRRNVLGINPSELPVAGSPAQ